MQFYITTHTNVTLSARSSVTLDQFFIVAYQIMIKCPCYISRHLRTLHIVFNTYLVVLPFVWIELEAGILLNNMSKINSNFHITEYHRVRTKMEF